MQAENMLPAGYKLWENPCAYHWHVKMLVAGEWRLLKKDDRLKMTFGSKQIASRYARDHHSLGLAHDQAVPNFVVE